MNELTLKQQKFADEYIISGNATEAYKKAYINVKKDTTANANGSRMLRNDKVAAYIKKQTESLRSSKVMDQQEVMEHLTSIARGESKKAIYRSTEKVGKRKIKKEREYEHSPEFEEQLRALEQIGKRYAMWTDKQEVIGDVSVTFVDDIGSYPDGD